LADFEASTEGVLALLALVESDDRLAPPIRRRIARLNSVAIRNPPLALDRLDVLAATYAPRLGRSVPDKNLARCVGTEVFWTHHLDNDVKIFFTDPDSYQLHVEEQPNQQLTLESELSRSEPLFPQAHSWMTYSAEIAGLSGQDTRLALDLGAFPPLVTFQLPLDRLLASGVTVRDPRGLDAVPERLLVWRPTGLRSGFHEVVDGDVPRSALGAIEWRR
jgi:hypothetical protein